jgi:hypothetical protein
MQKNTGCIKHKIVFLLIEYTDIMISISLHIFHCRQRRNTVLQMDYYAKFGYALQLENIEMGTLQTLIFYMFLFQDARQSKVIWGRS